MRASIPLLTAAALIAGRPALADFALVNSPNSGPKEAASDAETVPSGAPVPLSIQSEALLPPVPRFSTARGFGKHIPLSFAARQIVPPTIKISFASEVDSAVRVDWSGGRPWNRVLEDLIEPLGLQMTVSHQTVSISQIHSRERG